MRNLKRALSLTLASVMMLGMMVVGSSAAQGFPDVDDEDNVEAIEVAQAIGVMIGDENGNFRPESPVSRAEMATVMARLLNLDYDYYVSSCPFYDVSGVYDWARGPVGACYANKIVSGRGEGVYDPGATVTAVEASAMMMRSLGYFQYSNDYADGFELATVRQGTAIGIYDQVGSSATEPMTRNQVAQMVLNALQSGTVRPDGNTINLTTPDGSVLTGKVNYTYVTDSKPFASAISEAGATSIGSVNSGNIVELGEQLYNGELRLKANDEDVFGRPSRTWEYKGKAIGTYVKVELLRQEWSVKVTGKDLYELLTKNTIDNYSFDITVDGVEHNDADAKAVLDKAWFDENAMFRANDKGVGETGKGVLTQVFVDTNNKLVYIAVINTYLAKAAEDYNEKDEKVTLNVYKLDNKNTVQRPVYVKTNIDNPEAIAVPMEDFDVSGVKKDDFFLVQVADASIQTMAKPEVIDKTVISAFSKGEWVNNGTKYDYASTAKYDVEVLDQYDVKNMKNLTYNIFLDQYGYLIGLERNEDPDQYVFLTGINLGSLNTAVTTADANVIHLDGTMKNVRVNLKDSDLPSTDGTINLSQVNTWCKYSVDTTGVYTLEEITKSTSQNETKVSASPVKVAQYAQNVAQYYDNGTPSQKIISQRYWSLNASGTDNTDVTFVYGNENSVYINVTLKAVDVDCGWPDFSGNGAKRMIIDDVDSVVTDVANVNTQVHNLRTGVDGESGYVVPRDEIYTLYNDKNVVIAAVTIGEDNGTNVRYVTPVKDTLEEEDYGHGDSARVVDGKWTWHRKVVTLDGTVEVITETGDTLKYIGPYENAKKGMKQGVWYEIRLNADGDVRYSKAVVFSKTNDKYADSLEDANAMAPKYDTVIMWEQGKTMTGLKLEKNGMLYAERVGEVDQQSRRGIYIDEDTKVVLITADEDSKIMKNQWTGTGRSGLETALTRMNADSDKFDKDTVELSAVIKMGRTTVVVINDKNPEPSVYNPHPKPGFGSDTTGYEVYWDEVRTMSELRRLLDTYGTVRILADGGTITSRVYIPAGTTLIFEDALNLASNSLVIGENGKLIVENSLSLTTQAIPAKATVEAGSITVNNPSAVKYEGTIKVVEDEVLGTTGNMTLNGVGDVTFAGTVSVDGTLGVNNSSKDLYIEGNTSAKEVTGSGTTHGIIVKTANTLRVSNDVTNILITVGIGDHRYNGRVIIGGSLLDTAKFKDNNAPATANGTTPLQDIKEILGDIVLNKKSQVTTEYFAPAHLTAGAGAKIILEKGTSDDGTTYKFQVTDETGTTAVPVTDEETTIVIGGTGVTGVTDATPIPADEKGTVVDSAAYEAYADVNGKTLYGTVTELFGSIWDDVHKTGWTKVGYAITLQKNTEKNTLSEIFDGIYRTGADAVYVVCADVAIYTNGFTMDVEEVSVKDGCTLTIDDLIAGSTLKITSGDVQITGTMEKNVTLEVGPGATLTLNNKVSENPAWVINGTLVNGSEESAEAQSKKRG